MSVKKKPHFVTSAKALFIGVGLMTLAGCNTTLSTQTQSSTAASIPTPVTTPLTTTSNSKTLAEGISWQSPLLQDHPFVGQVFNTRTRHTVSPTELSLQLQESKLLLIGEKHDNPDHHQIESLLLKQQLSATSSVVFEMLDDQQNDKLSTLNTKDSLETLNEKLNWNNKGWDWQAYGPLIQLSLRQQASIIPGNVSKPLLKTIYSNGTDTLVNGLTDNQDQQKRFATVDTPSADVKKQIQQLVYESHCKMMPLEQMTPMVNVQLARDASMASAISAGMTDKDRVILVAGGFHTRKDLGVPLHLQALIPETKPLVILLMEVEEGTEQLSDYPNATEEIADYVWFTPKFTDRDYCDDLKPKASS